MTSIIQSETPTIFKSYFPRTETVGPVELSANLNTLTGGNKFTVHVPKRFTRLEMVNIKVVLTYPDQIFAADEANYDVAAGYLIFSEIIIRDSLSNVLARITGDYFYTRIQTSEFNYGEDRTAVGLEGSFDTSGFDLTLYIPIYITAIFENQPSVMYSEQDLSLDFTVANLTNLSYTDAESNVYQPDNVAYTFKFLGDVDSTITKNIPISKPSYTVY